jgi:hypothetical protein
MLENHEGPNGHSWSGALFDSINDYHNLDQLHRAERREGDDVVLPPPPVNPRNEPQGDSQVENAIRMLQMQFASDAHNFRDFL